MVLWIVWWENVPENLNQRHHLVCFVHSPQSPPIFTKFLSYHYFRIMFKLADINCTVCKWARQKEEMLLNPVLSITSRCTSVPRI